MGSLPVKALEHIAEGIALHPYVLLPKEAKAKPSVLEHYVRAATFILDWLFRAHEHLHPTVNVL
ncbi:hypothetical protein PInf_010177 [Phytophthora infestans]|nr:hypothetical protein PInf_010177 [Phytophthora infestans]